MYQIKSPISKAILLMSLKLISVSRMSLFYWSIESIPGGHDFQLYGFFDNPEQADEAWVNLREDFPENSPSLKMVFSCLTELGRSLQGSFSALVLQRPALGAALGA